MEEKLIENNIEEKVKECLKSGTDLFENNKIEEAFKMFDSALELDPYYADSYIIKGEALMDMFDMEEAENCVKTYLKFNPHSTRALEDLMNIHYEWGHFSESLIYCNKLLEKDSDNSNLYARKAFLHSCLDDDMENAFELYDKAINLKPDFYQAICDKAKLLSECRCNKEALQVYKQAILVAPDLPEAYMGVAFACIALGDKKNALSFSKKACELDPENEFYICHSSVMSHL